MAIKHFSIVLLFVCMPAFAGTFEVQLNGLSYHYDRSLHLNEVNPGLGITYKSHGLLAAAAGYYDNSYDHTTFYLLGGPVWHYGPFRAGVLVGAVSGYERDTHMHWTPAVVPTFSAWRVNMIVTPWFAAVNFTVARF